MGERGIGKSSLLRKFEQIAKGQDCIVVRREVDASVDSIEKLMLFILEGLKEEGAQFMPLKQKASDKVRSFFSTYKIGISLMGQGVSVEKLQTSVAIQDKVVKELFHVWTNINGNVRGVLFLLDEAERLQRVEGAWSFLRSVFTRISEENAGFMLVVSGKLGLFKGIKEIFSPIERFLLPMEVKPMSIHEVSEVLEKPLAKSKREVREDATKLIHHYSSGHPYVVQTFGFCCFEDGARIVDAKVVRRVLPNVMTRLSAQLFRNRFDATSQQERKVLLSLSKLNGQGTITEISSLATLRGGLTVILNRLVEKDCVIKIKRGEYALFNPLFGEYVSSIMSSESAN